MQRREGAVGWEDFVGQIARRGPMTTEQAETAARVVAEVLGERLSRLEAEALADELPHELADPLRRARHGQELELPVLVARVARREKVRLGVASQHVAVVAQTMAESVRGEVLDRLRLELPERIARLFDPRTEQPSPPAHRGRGRRTLAEGSPGSSRPLSTGGKGQR